MKNYDVRLSDAPYTKWIVQGKNKAEVRKNVMNYKKAWGIHARIVSIKEIEEAQ